MLPSRLWYRHCAAVNTAATFQITGTIGSRGGSYMNYLGVPRTHACSKQVYAGILAAFFRANLVPRKLLRRLYIGAALPPITGALLSS
jgi:hypothetical protein